MMPAARQNPEDRRQYPTPASQGLSHYLLTLSPHSSEPNINLWGREELLEHTGLDTSPRAGRRGRQNLQFVLGVQEAPERRAREAD